MDALLGAASPTNFSALAIFIRGDVVVKIVLIGLLGAEPLGPGLQPVQDRRHVDSLRLGAVGRHH